MNVLLTISYDGTNYCGWQSQKDCISVQQRLEEALSDLFRCDVSVLGASRTDAGVHALGQRALFSDQNWNNGVINVPLNKLPYAINARLPKDIVITKAEAVPDDFHPIALAKRKTYAYTFYISPFANPMRIHSAYHISHPLDIDAMRNSLSYFTGEHDFKAFCATGGYTKTSVRTIYCIELIENNEELILRICGNGFLYNMVRIIAGTLLYIGEGKIKPDAVPDIILSRKRENAGKTVPSQGLTLICVDYGY